MHTRAEKAPPCVLITGCRAIEKQYHQTVPTYRWLSMKHARSDLAINEERGLAHKAACYLIFNPVAGREDPNQRTRTRSANFPSTLAWSRRFWLECGDDKIDVDPTRPGSAHRRQESQPSNRE